MRSVFKRDNVSRASADRVALLLTESLLDRQALPAGVFSVFPFCHHVHRILARADPVHHFLLVDGETDLRLGVQPCDELGSEIGTVVNESPTADVARGGGGGQDELSA